MVFALMASTPPFDINPDLWIILGRAGRELVLHPKKRAAYSRVVNSDPDQANLLRQALLQLSAITDALSGILKDD